MMDTDGPKVSSWYISMFRVTLSMMMIGRKRVSLASLASISQRGGLLRGQLRLRTNLLHFWTLAPVIENGYGSRLPISEYQCFDVFPEGRTTLR